MNHKPKIIVISFDGLGTADWPIIEKLPGFSRFLKEAAYCTNVESVYPSLTYPAHCSIATGRLPIHHGVIQNTLLQINRMASPDWYWKRSHIKGKTIYEAAKEKGMKTATFLWPVTAGAKIDYHIPEIFANRKWDNQVFTSLRNGSKKFQIEIFARYGKLMKGLQEPYLDNFIHESVKYTLKKYEPDLTMIHLIELDEMRHHFGHDSAQALMALKHHDQRLMELMDLMEGEPVTWVILGDHSSLDWNIKVRLNRVLHRHDWLVKAEDGVNIKDYKVMLQGGDGSAYIYANPRLSAEERLELAEEVRKVVEAFSAENHDCIEAIYTGEEAAQMGADGNCLLMLEAKEGYVLEDSFGEADLEEIIPQKDGKEPDMQRATHGYLPTKEGYKTVFAMRGSCVRPGEITTPMSLIDEGPTIAHIFAGELPQADGRVMKEFFNE